MPTLLVLGSKPSPALPPPGSFVAVACANASGFSARSHGLPEPDYTVMTAVLTSGKASDNHSLRALAGLRTRRLYIYPRPPGDRGSLLGSWRTRLKGWRMTPAWMKHQLRRIGYRWDETVVHPSAWYRDLIIRLAGDDPTVRAIAARKLPSTGMVAVALGLADPRFDRVVMAGFDFTLTHAYGTNPLIADRAEVASKHADTDVTVLAAFVASGRPLVTSEPTVHARAGVPLIEGAVPPG